MGGGRVTQGVGADAGHARERGHAIEHRTNHARIDAFAGFSKEDRKDMRDENGIIRVDCAFCSREFLIED